MLSLIRFIFNFNFNFSSTTWNITGSLIVQKEFLESDMVCTEGRTLIIPVRLGQKLSRSTILLGWEKTGMIEHLDQVPDVQWRDGHLWRAWWARELPGQLQILRWVRIKPRWKTKSIMPYPRHRILHFPTSSAQQNKSLALTTNLYIIARYRLFHEKAKKSAAVEKFCAHGGRYIFWLPYRCKVPITIFISCNVNTSRGWDDISGTVNVTYFGDESPFTLEEVSFILTNNPMLLEILMKIDANE